MRASMGMMRCVSIERRDSFRRTRRRGIVTVFVLLDGRRDGMSHMQCTIQTWLLTLAGRRSGSAGKVEHARISRRGWEMDGWDEADDGVSSIPLHDLVVVAMPYRYHICYTMLPPDQAVSPPSSLHTALKTACSWANSAGIGPAGVGGFMAIEEIRGRQEKGEQERSHRIVAFTVFHTAPWRRAWPARQKRCARETRHHKTTGPGERHSVCVCVGGGGGNSVGSWAPRLARASGRSRPPSCNKLCSVGHGLDWIGWMDS